MCEHFGQSSGARTVISLPKTRSTKQQRVEMKRPVMTLSINREGMFTIPYSARRKEGQCGSEGATIYNYQVKITASNKSLTDAGYVMEIQYIDDYFQAEYTQNPNPEAVSCEDMAQRAVEFLVAKFYADEELAEVDLRKIYVRVSGSPISFIEAEWQRGV